MFALLEAGGVSISVDISDVVASRYERHYRLAQSQRCEHQRQHRFFVTMVANSGSTASFRELNLANQSLSKLRADGVYVRDSVASCCQDWQRYLK